MKSEVIIGKGDISGRGVYADRSFKKGEIVIRYHLKPLSIDEYRKLSDEEAQFVHTHRGVSYLYGEPERYVNNSKDPNTVQDLTNQCDVAARDIRAGEKITTDASKDDTE